MMSFKYIAVTAMDNKSTDKWQLWCSQNTYESVGGRILPKTIKPREDAAAKKNKKKKDAPIIRNAPYII